MCVSLGGYTSFYYVGMLMVLITFTTIMPLNVMQSFKAGLVLLMIYCVPVLVFSTPTEEGVRIFTNNMFFFTFFISISRSNATWTPRPGCTNSTSGWSWMHSRKGSPSMPTISRTR
jgi:hypothetical protein